MVFVNKKEQYPLLSGACLFLAYDYLVGRVSFAVNKCHKGYEYHSKFLFFVFFCVYLLNAIYSISGCVAFQENVLLNCKLNRNKLCTIFLKHYRCRVSTH